MDVTNWLKHKNDYNIGLALYIAHPKHNSNIAKRLSRGENANNYHKLKYELNKLLKEGKPTKAAAPPLIISKATPKKTIVSKALVNHNKKPPVYFHELPSEVRPYLLEANNSFKELCFLKVELNNVAPKSEKKALELQQKIHTKRQENILAWEKIDYYKKYKKLPAPNKGEFEDLTPAKLLLRKQYHEQNISKLKKRIRENSKLLKTAPDQTEINRLNRAIERQEAAVLKKTEQLLKLKSLING